MKTKDWREVLKVKGWQIPFEETKNLFKRKKTFLVWATDPTHLILPEPAVVGTYIAYDEDGAIEKAQVENVEENNGEFDEADKYIWHAREIVI